MSLERGPGRNSNYGWSNIGEPPEDPVVNAWVAALFAKPMSWEEYEEMRRIAAERTRIKGAKP